MKILTISNQKGGVGKSSIAVNFAYFLRDKCNAKVLVVDLDHQGNCSKTLGKYVYKHDASYVLENRATENEKCPDQKITVIKGNVTLADIDHNSNLDSIVKNMLSWLELFDSYDYCVIDTPPALGVRMTAALMVSDFVVTPIQLEQYAIDGIVNMLSAIQNIKRNYNNKIKFIGMLVNLFDRRLVDQKDTLKQLQESYSNLMIPYVIGWKSAIPKSIATKTSLWDIKTTASRSAVKDVEKVFDYMVKEMKVGGE